MKKYLYNWRKPAVGGFFDEACLELGKDTVHWSTLVNCLKRFDSKTITYNYYFPMSKRAFLSKRQVNYI